MLELIQAHGSWFTLGLLLPPAPWLRRGGTNIYRAKWTGASDRGENPL